MLIIVLEAGGRELNVNVVVSVAPLLLTVPHGDPFPDPDAGIVFMHTMLLVVEPVPVE